MSKLPVTIDYIKLAQWVKQIEYYTGSIKKELDRAVEQQKDKNVQRIPKDTTS